VTDVVGEPLPAPVLGLVERAAEALDDLIDLRVQIGNLLLGGVRRDDVDEFVLSCSAHVSPYGLCGCILGPPKGGHYPHRVVSGFSRTTTRIV
jgi:hypothetical protein